MIEKYVYKLSIFNLANNPTPQVIGSIYLKSLHKSKKCTLSLFLKISNFSNYGA